MYLLVEPCEGLDPRLQTRFGWLNLPTFQYRIVIALPTSLVGDQGSVIFLTFASPDLEAGITFVRYV